MLDNRIKFLASLYTIILIVMVIGLLLFGDFDFKSKHVKGQAIQAIMVDISQIKTNKNTKPPTKTNKPVKKTETKKPKIKPPKKTNQIKPKTSPKKPAIIQKKQPPKINTKALEKERKEQLERDKKKKALKKRKQDNKKKLEQAKRDLEAFANNSTKQKEDTKESPTKQGINDSDKKNELMSLWINAVQSAVYQQWSQPASTAQDMQCSLKVKQIPGGAVVNVAFTSPCNASEIVKKSIVDAIMKAEPLPYKGFEKVFDRNAIFTFKAQE